MPDAPLQPFSPPTFLSFSAPSGGSFVGWFLVVIFGCWAVYTLVAIYHWFRYSHQSAIALPAIGVHLFVSLVLMGYAFSGAL